ncbi:GyrI-like domain-containing protein [Aureitalea sp. L0-47]|uniref:AraC family transcriptional regulator n=1 Tax=Aureitalea sp. L0-47 TaxID=2816962 RepID=UPI002238FE2D|nr:GyrI-like domain-containing protein [Aureitalea sp. L0-47]MCW5519433.1 GyrI-like domain-containing protein [Aureitalea sp. L0-47]
MLTAVSNIKITRLPKRTLAYVRNVGPYMGDTELFGRLFNTVMEWAAPKGLMTEKTEAITVYHDDPCTVPEEKQRISVGFTVPEKTITPEGIHLMTLPEGKYIVGSYEILPEEYKNAWKEVLDFIRDENITPTTLEFESYKNDPNTHPEGKHIVDICVQIE